MNWGDKINRTVIIICIVGIAVGLLVVFTTGNGIAGSKEKTQMVEKSKSEPNNIPYVGISACKKCHLKEYMSWKNTTMAKTFEVLKPKMSVEIKKKFDLDPEKDYTKDTSCLPCHTTGYGRPGGYAMPKAGDTKAQKMAKENEGTTCEGCHGPGSKYIELHEEIAKKKRKYAVQEFYDAGMTKMGPKTCTPCHNPKNPTAPEGYKFDYEKQKLKGNHKNFPLKYRTD